MEEQVMNVPWEEFDLSLLTYQQFLVFFFDRAVVSDPGDQFDLFHSTIDSFVASNPTIVVEHVQAMCRNLAELATVYSQDQLDQGLWMVFGAGIDCQQYLSDPMVDVKLRVDCVESMYLPFSSVFQV